MTIQEACNMQGEGLKANYPGAWYEKRKTHFRCFMFLILHGAYFTLHLKYEIFSKRHLDIPS